MRGALLLATLMAAVFSVNGGKLSGNDLTVAEIISYMNDRNIQEKEMLPEEDLTVPEIISYNGFIAEIHEALTTDGYYLTLHRIPRGRKETTDYRNTVRPVMFLQHGLLCSSSNWVTNLRNESLAFILADAGFDVWMGNVRGNTYSKRHKTLSVKDSAFWNFSFDEMAKYDLPAMIDYVLQTTGQTQLYYVGHSQGTMIVFAGLSENVELQKKIRKFFALAPVTRLRYIYSPIKLFAPFEIELKFVLKELGINQFLPSLEAIDLIAKYVCPVDEDMCQVVLELIAGYEKNNLNQTRIPVYLTHTPAGTSVKNMYHFAQLVNAQVFQKYDYGRIENMVKYNSTRPPLYHFEVMETPTIIFSGSEDWLASPKDVAWIVKQMQNLESHIEIAGYNHLDFIWGKTAANDAYQKIIDIASGDTN